MPLRPPRHPRYAVLRRLGRGGAGTVYLARDLLDDQREVALKVSHRAIGGDQILKEFRILRDLRHPGIARAFDCGRLPHGGLTYFTSEYVAGPSLESHAASLRRQKREDFLEVLIEVFLQVSLALAYLHRKGGLHLDIKPSNIVLCGGRAKLIDFGLFESVHAGAGRRPRGTAYYTAPEVLDGGPVDPRTDLYSLGVTLYRCLTGEHPIGGRSLEEIAENHRRTPPHPPRGLPQDLSRIILRLLAKSPLHRFQSAEELAKALRGLLSRSPEIPAAPLEEPEFCGRRRDLEAFFGWLDQLGGRAGDRLLLVEGEPGIGKSRFADACATETLGRGCQLITHRCVAASGDDDLRRLIEKLLVLQPRARRQRTRFRFLLASLGISSSASVLGQIRLLDLEQIRARVFQEACALLAEVRGNTGRPPLVLLIEDLHRGSAQLRDLVRRLGDARLAAALAPGIGILATLRPGPELERIAPARSSGTRAIRLSPLRRREAAEALKSLERLTGAPTAPELLARGKGNPGLLVELFHRRLRGWGLGALEGERESGIEHDLAGLLRERLGAMSERARQLAGYLSLLDRPAPEPLLRELTGFAPGELREARRSLAELGLLRGGEGGFYLDHGLLGERPFPGLESREAARAAQARIGRQLARDRRRLREAAHHLLRGGELEQGLAAAERAVKELQAAGRVEEALLLLAEALPHARDPRLRLAFLEAQGDLQTKSGEFAAAAASYERLLRELELAPAERLRLLRKRGGVHQRSGDNEGARLLFEEALQILETTDELEEHLQILNELAALYLFRGELSRSTTFANRGLELLRSAEADKLGPEKRALHAFDFHSLSGHILLRQFEYERAAVELAEGLKLADRLGALSNTALILNNLGIAYHQANRLSAALAVYRRATALARRMGDETALFSIQCNVAALRARKGEMQKAMEMLAAVEEMPHSRSSSRARLYLLHSKGLVERLAYRDARALWKESITLADELPDPLFASYGRVYLLENEILQGRWAAARGVLEELHGLEQKDSRLGRTIAVRRAWLEALCGHAELASSLLEAVLPPPERAGASRRPHCGELWDEVIASMALMEAGELEAAKGRLERAWSSFERSRQHSGALECALLLADADLRRRDPEAAAAWLQRARRALSRHDSSQGSRAAAVRLPFLEARAAMQASRANQTYISDRLVDAAGNLPHGAAWELVWLLDLTSAEQSQPGARRRMKASLARFAAGLAAADQKSYLARSHRARLGLAGREASQDEGEVAGARNTGRQLEALFEVRRAKDAGRALDLVLRACASRRGAIFLDDSRRLAAWRGPGEQDRTELDELRAGALTVGSGRLGSGFCAEIHAGRGRLGVLFADLAGKNDGEELRAAGAFLEVAAQLLGGVLAGRPAASRPELASTPTFEAQLKSALKTRTFSPADAAASASPRMQELLTLIRRTRESRLPVLLTGESGTGKDYLARWIHALSPRRDGPFLGQDCAAIPEGLLEADLFGHEAGAFTGAHRSRSGYLLAASGGTFYLDNVDSLSLEMQAKLLRVIDEEELRPVGGESPLKIDVRFIASTQRELKELSARGEFRSDLYFRLAGICLMVPPLRERVEDIPLLVGHFQREIPGREQLLSSEALEVFRGYAWPGNVRELEAVVRRLALTVEGSAGAADVLRALGIEQTLASFPRWIFEGKRYDQLLDEFKREYLLYLFERCQGDMERIALELGTTKRNVYLRFSQAGLRPVDLRARGEARGE
jgi:DNA-binding NtrC family response regulator/tetratricopeptide (TPR) repeat protein/predicted Ser/Thr protein kinase